MIERHLSAFYAHGCYVTSMSKKGHVRNRPANFVLADFFIDNSNYPFHAVLWFNWVHFGSDHGNLYIKSIFPFLIQQYNIIINFINSQM